MKKMKLFKTSKNDGLSQDFFGRAKRAGKSLILGFQEKNTVALLPIGSETIQSSLRLPRYCCQC